MHPSKRRRLTSRHYSTRGSSYEYRSLTLSPHAIRLLRLLPHQDEAADIRCELFEYSLEGFHLYRYDAVSYVWGKLDETLPIYVDGHRFDVTTNLHTAILQLRHQSFARLLWVDALCINQHDQAEKEQQIQFMPTIYSQASCVLVWLGQSGNESDLACERIRNAANKRHTKASDSAQAKWAERQLLKRAWFRRIWVLQEVAAARDVVIMCGQQMIDRGTFCLGIDTDDEMRHSTGLMSIIRPVCYLMKEPLPATQYSMPISPQSSLAISPLGELVEMYFTHEATKRHDKVYALLGMCSDNLSKAGLSPDYQTPWDILLKRLIKHLLSDQITVETHADRQVAVIKSKGRFLGTVLERTMHRSQDDWDTIRARFTNLLNLSGDVVTFEVTLVIKRSASRVKAGDMICLLQGSSTLTILRPFQDYFQVIVISIEMSRDLEAQLHGPNGRPSGLCTEILTDLPCVRDLLLVWQRETSVIFSETSITSSIVKEPGVTRPTDIVLHPDDDDFENWRHANSWGPKQADSCGEWYLNKAIRTWNVALMLEDKIETDHWGNATDFARDDAKAAGARYEDAIINCEIGLGKRGTDEGVKGNALNTFISMASNSSTGQTRETLLSRAAHRGHCALIKFLLDTGQVDVNVPSTKWERDGIDIPRDWGLLKPETPLQTASRQGHSSAVQILLDADGIDVCKGQPLVDAAMEGHEAVTRLLLQTGCIDVNAWNSDKQTPLWCAAGLGHETIVKLLLDSPYIDVDKKASGDHSTTPLHEAAKCGHAAIVRSFLETEQVAVDCEDDKGITPMLAAASRGHEAVVKLLLDTGSVHIDHRNHDNETPLWGAANCGNEAIVDLLLQTGKAEPDHKNHRNETPLFGAASHGHEAVVKSLLKTGKVDVNCANNIFLETPLLEAASHGFESVIQLILKRRKANINLANHRGDTPLHKAARAGHYGVVRLLLGTGRADLNQQNCEGWTPLLDAVYEEHESVVLLIIETRKADVNLANAIGDTPLHKVAQSGNEALAKALLETGKVDVDQKNLRGRKPVDVATDVAIIKLLLEAHSEKATLHHASY